MTEVMSFESELFAPLDLFDDNSSSSSVDFNDGGSGTTMYSCGDLTDPDTKFIWGGIYIILVTLGLFGNAIVIAMILRVICNKGLLTNVYIYVICLSSVDLAYLATGPFVISYLLTGTWIFGEAVCHIVYIFEGLNKTMSIYLLVVLSGDRYLAACRPTTSARYRSVRAAVVAFIILSVAVAVSNIPIYMYTEVKSAPHAPQCYQCGISFPMINGWSESGPKHVASPTTDNESLSNVITKPKLHSFNLSTTSAPFSITLISTNSTTVYAFEPPNPWANLVSYYTLFLIIVYYLLPTFFILIFYFKIMKRLRQQYRLIRKKSTKRNRVTKTVLAVISFYFICWTPYWILQSISIFWPSLHGNADFANVFVYLATSIYTLPYVHACIDPILYAFLNKHLWIAYAASTRRRMNRNGKLPESSIGESGISIYQMNNSILAHNDKMSLAVRCSDSLRAWLEKRPPTSSVYEQVGNNDRDLLTNSESFGSRRPILQQSNV